MGAALQVWNAVATTKVHTLVVRRDHPWVERAGFPDKPIVQVGTSGAYSKDRRSRLHDNGGNLLFQLWDTGITTLTALHGPVCGGKSDSVFRIFDL